MRLVRGSPASLDVVAELVRRPEVRDQRRGLRTTAGRRGSSGRRRRRCKPARSGNELTCRTMPGQVLRGGAIVGRTKNAPGSRPERKPISKTAWHSRSRGSAMTTPAAGGRDRSGCSNRCRRNFATEVHRAAAGAKRRTGTAERLDGGRIVDLSSHLEHDVDI